MAPSADEIVLEARDLRKAFGGIRAVDGCSFVVPHGRISGLIGPILGAVLLYTAQELTWVNFPTAHLIAYGLFIVLVARFMPRGLVGFAIDRGWVRKGMVH